MVHRFLSRGYACVKASLIASQSLTKPIMNNEDGSLATKGLLTNVVGTEELEQSGLFFRPSFKAKCAS